MDALTIVGAGGIGCAVGHALAASHPVIVAANPDKVRIETAGKSLVVTAEQLHGAERDAAWQQITTAAPRFKS